MGHSFRGLLSGYRLYNSKGDPECSLQSSDLERRMESQSLPKVDIFIWTIAHNGILTSENIRKKGWEGPSRCPFCKSHEESANHLLLNCSYANEVWNLAISPWSNVVVLPPDLHSLLCNWESLFPFPVRNKALLKFSWLILPKFILWKLWLD